MEIFGFTLSTSDLWLLGICGALIMALVGYHFALAIHNHNALRSASTDFRNIVLTELEGIYPVHGTWQTKDYPRFRLSIPKIETAATKFSHFVKRKRDFRIAIKAYRDYCQKITFEGVAGWFLYSKTREQLGGKTPNPVKEFEKIVDHLLPFAG